MNNTICCLYCYYEKNDEYQNNFNYFMNNGILSKVDYYIIINGPCTLDINNISKNNNIKIINKKNEGYDFGAYSYALQNYIHNKYDYYFFINTSVIGPYIDSSNKNWTDYFIELFTDKIKVVGTSINILTNESIYNNELTKIFGNKSVFPHVQSMFFCIDNEYFNYLMNIQFFNLDLINTMDFNEIIINKEIGLSTIALNMGWNINCILPKYKNLNYIKINKNINKSANKTQGDPYFTGTYFGSTIDKFEVIFFKNNRF